MAEQIVDLMEANMPVSSDVAAVARSAGGAAGGEAAGRVVGSLRSDLSGKVDKSGVGQVTMLNLSNEVKKALTGGSVPVVGDGSVYPGAIQPGAVTNDKVPVGELTANRLSMYTGLTTYRMQYSENVLDLRGTEVIRTAEAQSTGNTLASLGSETLTVTAGEADANIVLRIPIDGSPSNVRARVQIVPTPRGAFNGLNMDASVVCRVWNARDGEGVVDERIDLVNARYDDEECYLVYDGSNASGNNYLVVQFPVTAEERGVRFVLRVLASTGRGMNLVIPQGIRYDMVMPVSDLQVTGLCDYVMTGQSSGGRITGDTAEWTVVGGARAGVATFRPLGRIVNASMGRLRVDVQCDMPVRVSALVDTDSGLREASGFGRDLPAGTNTVEYDLAEIDAHAGAPLDRIWITGTQDGDYHLTCRFSVVDEFNGDGDLRGTLRRIESLATQPPEERTLSSPDGTRWRLTIGDDGTIGAQRLSKTVTRVHVIGNSLTYEGSAGWRCGMAAPDPEHDWYWLTYRKLKARNPAVLCHCWDDEDKSTDTMTRVNGYAFEQSADQTSIAMMADTVPADADLVILQMGDNVNTDERRGKFNLNVAGLARAVREKAPEAVIVWLGIWFNQPAIVDAIRDAMARVGGWWVPINDLCTPVNQNTVGATCTWPDRTQHQIDTSGVAMHPGPAGMQAIADRLWQTLDPLVKQA